jgi:hypothetical protein
MLRGLVGVTRRATGHGRARVVATLLFTVAEAVHAPISTAAAASGAAPAAAGPLPRHVPVLVRRRVGDRARVLRGLYDISHALPFLVLGLVNALSVPALLRLEEPLTARSRTH